LLVVVLGRWFLGAITVVGISLGDQPLGQVVVDIEPFRLKIRAEWSADFRALVPIDIQPTEAIQHGLDGPWDEARLVGVFNPDDEFAAVVAGKKPVEKGRPDVADMGQSSGARRKPNADFSGQVNSPAE
jgi:hypothetical protein